MLQLRNVPEFISVKYVIQYMACPLFWVQVNPSVAPLGELLEPIRESMLGTGGFAAAGVEISPVKPIPQGPRVGSALSAALGGSFQ